MNATEINAETARQLRALIPAALKVQGKTYRHSRFIGDEANMTVRMDFDGRKARGALISSKVTISVTYNRSLDLYNLKAEHFDGATFETSTLLDWEGITWEAFRQVEAWLARA